jgi:hypothetical protein
MVGAAGASLAVVLFGVLPTNQRRIPLIFHDVLVGFGGFGSGLIVSEVWGTQARMGFIRFLVRSPRI